jgi:hypothetical protein
MLRQSTDKPFFSKRPPPRIRPGARQATMDRVPTKHPTLASGRLSWGPARGHRALVAHAPCAKKLVKIGARIVRRGRYVVFQLAACPATRAARRGPCPECPGSLWFHPANRPGLPGQPSEAMTSR